MNYSRARTNRVGELFGLLGYIYTVDAWDFTPNKKGFVLYDYEHEYSHLNFNNLLRHCFVVDVKQS